LAGTAVVGMLSGCASPPYALNPVGPGPGSATGMQNSGYLKVYTATRTHEVGEQTFYYTHTGYSVYSESGKMVKYVPNHMDEEDQTPTVVDLPSGNYRIEAKSDLYSSVLVPVVIQDGRTTEIFLDSSWKPPTDVSQDQIVTLPNGEAVGWRSAATN